VKTQFASNHCHFPLEGLDAFDYLLASCHVDGTLPNVAKGQEVIVDAYDEELNKVEWANARFFDSNERK